MARYGRILILLALLAAVGVGVWPRLWAPNGEHKHYVHQARAFLNGRLDIDDDFGDVATFDGKHFVVFPPLPALILIPLMALLGDDARTTLISVALTIASVFVLRNTLRRLGSSETERRWLLAAFFLGTAYTTALFQSYETWHYAHMVAVLFLLLAVNEALGHGRGALVGLYCGLAFLSRQLSVYALPFLVVASLKRRSERGDDPPLRLVQLAATGVCFAACAGVYLWLNWARFGSPWDTGYAYIHLEGFLAQRVERFGLFHPAYVPFNLSYMLLQGPHVVFADPALLRVAGVDPFGTSILFASPFALVALWARWERKLLWAAWLWIVLVIVHTAFYYNNGFAQTNAQRFTLDFWPVLIVLVALGIKRVRAPIWKSAIAYAITLNAIALILVWHLQKLTECLTA